jgi:hypothetical protein
MLNTRIASRIMSVAGVTITISCSFSTETFPIPPTDGGTSTTSSTDAGEGGAGGAGGTQSTQTGSGSGGCNEVTAPGAPCDDTTDCGVSCQTDHGTRCDTQSDTKTCVATVINEINYNPSKPDLSWIEIHGAKNLNLNGFAIELIYKGNSLQIPLENAATTTAAGYFVLACANPPSIKNNIQTNLPVSTISETTQVRLIANGYPVDTVNINLASATKNPVKRSKFPDGCRADKYPNKNCTLDRCDSSLLSPNCN